MMSTLYQSVDELEQPYSDWLDAEQSLPANVTLLAKRGVASWWPKVGFVLAPLLIVVGLGAVITLLQQGVMELTVALVRLPLAFGIVGGGVVALIMSLRWRREGVARATGRFRYGIFLSDDTLLLRLAPKRCYLIQRESLLEVSSAHEKDPNGFGSGIRVTLIAATSADKGVRIQFWAREVAAADRPGDRIEPIIVEWAQLSSE